MRGVERERFLNLLERKRRLIELAQCSGGNQMRFLAQRLRRRFFSQPAQDPTLADPLAIDPQLVIDYLEKTVQHTIGAAE